VNRNGRIGTVNQPSLCLTLDIVIRYNIEVVKRGSKYYFD